MEEMAKKAARRTHGGPRKGSGRPDMGMSGLKRGGVPVNTLLYPAQKEFIQRFASDHHITLSEAFREIVAQAMERYGKE